MPINIEGPGGGGGGGGGEATVFERKTSDVTSGTDATNLTFDYRGSWDDVMPNPEQPWGVGPNKLKRFGFDFNVDSLTSNTNRFETFLQNGTAPSTTLSNGELTITAQSAFGSQSWNTGHHPIVPFYSVMLRVEDIDLAGGAFGSAGNAADMFIGVVNSSDSNAMITAGWNASVDRFEVFTRNVAGNTNSTSLGGSVSDYAAAGTGDDRFDMLVTFAGDECWLAVRDVDDTGEPSEWEFIGSATFGSNIADFYDLDIWGTDGGNWTNCWRSAIGGSRSVTISKYEVFHGMGLGLRDPHPITYKDGGPMLEDGKLWMTGTTGSANNRGTCVVYTLDVDTLDIELQAKLFANAEDNNGNFDDYTSNYVAPHMMYNEDRDRFTVLWSAFGNGPNDPNSTFTPNRPVFVTHTSKDIRRGVHHLKCSPANLPRDGPIHDAFVVYDSSAGAWRCIHNSDLINKVSISETSDDDLQSGWSELGSHTDNTNDIEGGCITRVNGSYIAAMSDPSQTNDLAWVSYPNMNTLTGMNLDRVPGDPDAPWATVIPIPWKDDQTRYLLISMDETTRGGLGASTQGALQFYLSEEREDGYEYPARRLIRPW